MMKSKTRKMPKTNAQTIINIQNRYWLYLDLGLSCCCLSLEADLCPEIDLIPMERSIRRDH